MFHVKNGENLNACLVLIMSETIIVSSDSSSLEDDETFIASCASDSGRQFDCSGISRVCQNLLRKRISRDSRECHDMQETETLKTRGTMCSSDDNDFDLQRAIEESLQEKTLTSQGRNHSTLTKDSKRNGRSSRKRNERQQKSTWCKKRKEREEQLRLPETVRHFKRGSPTSPITISSEEDFDLPELGSDGDKTVSHTATTHRKVRSCAVETDDVHKGKDRHFMDTLSSLSLQNSENEQSQSVKTEISSRPKLQQRKDRISSEIQAGSSPVNVETIIAPSFHIEDQSGDRRADKQVKNGRVKFLLGHPSLQTEVNSLNKRFSHLQISMIECAAEDQGDSIFFSQILELLENFSHTHKPPSVLVENVIRCGLLDVQHEELAFRSYCSVLTIWHHYPDLVLFDWTALQTAGDVLKKGLQARSAHFAKKSVNTSECNNNTRTESSSKEPTFHQAALFLQLMLQGLRINLKNCKLPDQSSVRKSLAFKSLSVEQSATFRHIIHWLECCLVTTEHLDSQSVSTDTDIKQKTKDSQCDKDRNIRLVLGHQEVSPWLLESLQNLLSLIVFVSEDRHETARKLSSDLLRTYIYLPNMRVKKQLLQTLSSPLLCFYLVCLVLENHCSNAIRMNSRFPESLNELTNCYFYASPPKSPVTPPPSPSDEDENMEEGSTHHHQYSAQSCEELAMLIFFVTKSFIACRQKREQARTSERTRRQQILLGPEIPSLSSSEREHVQEATSEFKQHLQELVPELSLGTQIYLHLIKALATAM